MPDPRHARRIQGLGTTVFSRMTALATEHDAVNLGQGFPDEDPHPALVEAVDRAMRDGHHQYAPGPGVPRLREAVAAHQQRHQGLVFDPDTDVTITFGATEAIAAAVLGLCDPGDEVLVVEPVYDAYSAVIALAGGVEVRVALDPPPHGAPDTGWRLDPGRLAAAVTPRTRLLILNSPHNPTGAVFDTDLLDAIAATCVEHDLVAITDEVYEHLVYDGRHVSLATRPGMEARTVSVSSAGKTFSCTGWKVGWACARGELSSAVRATKQYLSFSGGTPFQHAIADALRLPDAVVHEVADRNRGRRDLVVDALTGLGLPTVRSAGTYFVTADLAPVGFDDADAFCHWAPGAIGLAAVPVSAFVLDPAPVRSLVRLAFCKRDAVLAEGMERLAGALTGRSTSRP